MKVELPTGPDLPEWFTEFHSNYANTEAGIYGHVSLVWDGWSMYVKHARNGEYEQTIYPTAAEAIQAIVEFVNRQAKNNG